MVAKLIGTQSQWAPTRKQTVHWLIAGARDKSTGNVGLALNYLTGFSKNDFTKSGKDSLSAMLNKEQPYLDILGNVASKISDQQCWNGLRYDA